MNDQTKIILLWLMFVMCMILHYDYYVSDNFCGFGNEANTIGIERIPLMLLKTALHLLPMVFVLVIMFKPVAFVYRINLGLAVVYTAFNLLHLFSELGQEPFNACQLELLALSTVITGLLCLVSWRTSKTRKG